MSNEQTFIQSTPTKNQRNIEKKKEKKEEKQWCGKLKLKGTIEWMHILHNKLLVNGKQSTHKKRRKQKIRRTTIIACGYTVLL